MLKLVDGHQAGLVRPVQVCKNLIQRNGRVVDGAKPDTPDRKPVHVKRDFGAQGRHCRNKLLPRPPSLGPKFIYNRLSQHIHKITQVLGGIDVYHKAVVSATDFLIIEDMPNKVRFADATGRDKRNIVLIEQKLAE